MMKVRSFECQVCLEPPSAEGISKWNGHCIVADKGLPGEALKVHAMCETCCSKPIAQRYLLAKECFTCKESLSGGKRKILQINTKNEIVSELSLPSVLSNEAIALRSLGLIAVGSLLGGAGGFAVVLIAAKIAVGVKIGTGAAFVGAEASGAVLGGVGGGFLSQQLADSNSSSNPRSTRRRPQLGHP